MRSFFILGAAAAGKSTLIRALLGDERTRAGVWTLGNGYAAAGPYLGHPTDGADRVGGISVQALLATAPSTPLLLEGFRFATPHSIAAFAHRGRCGFVLLVAPFHVLEARRDERGGRAMPSGWYRKQSEQARAAAKFCPFGLSLDGTRPVEELAEDAARFMRHA